MKTLIKTLTLSAALAGLWLADLSPEAPFLPVFVADAQAIIGRPLTPVSYAGVARRTTRRAVVATDTVYATTETAAAQQQAAASQQQAAQAQQQAADNRLPSGTIVSALPAGCESTDVDGTTLFNCGGVMYKPTFQSNKLVYVVQ